MKVLCFKFTVLQRVGLTEVMPLTKMRYLYLLFLPKPYVVFSESALGPVPHTTSF